MPVGTVKFFNADKGYGFIAPDGGGDDSFVHISAVQAAGMHTLDKEQRVNFEKKDNHSNCDFEKWYNKSLFATNHSS